MDIPKFDLSQKGLKERFQEFKYHCRPASVVELPADNISAALRRLPPYSLIEPYIGLEVGFGYSSDPPRFVMSSRGLEGGMESTDFSAILNMGIKDVIIHTHPISHLSYSPSFSDLEPDNDACNAFILSREDEYCLTKYRQQSGIKPFAWIDIEHPKDGQTQEYTMLTPYDPDPLQQRHTYILRGHSKTKKDFYPFSGFLRASRNGTVVFETIPFSVACELNNKFGNEIYTDSTFPLYEEGLKFAFRKRVSDEASF